MIIKGYDINTTFAVVCGKCYMSEIPTSGSRSGNGQVRARGMSHSWMNHSWMIHSWIFRCFQQTTFFLRRYIVKLEQDPLSPRPPNAGGQNIVAFSFGPPAPPHYNVSWTRKEFHFRKVTKYSREVICADPNTKSFYANIVMWGKGDGRPVTTLFLVNATT